MRRGDYAAAAAAYQKAVGMEPSNSLYNGQLGAALVRTGQMDAAMDPLMRAASGGYARAFVYLGDVAASRGDTAGAIGYYQSYLATSPRDAAAVQAKIDRLSG
jgi:predicted negative regulator of RcsB-dependent stress response